jgi:hypothetical protein
VAAPLDAHPLSGVGPGLVPLEAATSSPSPAVPLPQASPEIITICATVVLEYLRKRLTHHQYLVRVVHGDVPPIERQGILDQFKSEVPSIGV